MSSATSPFTFKVQCPSCHSEFPVDSSKVPLEGIAVICSNCLRVFPVETPVEAEDWGEPDSSLAGDLPSESTEPSESMAFEAGEGAGAPGGPVEQSRPDAKPEAWDPFEDMTWFSDDDAEGVVEEGDSVEGKTLSGGMDRFGRRDPDDRARRLARVLVSDIIAYFPERYRQSLERGTVKEDFQEEIQKSWNEYVDQVGLEVAESTSHFNDALNEILGKGEDIF